MNSEKARLAGANAVLLTKGFSSPELTKCLIEAARAVADPSAFSLRGMAEDFCYC